MKEILTWEEFEDLSNKLYKKINQKYDEIICIATGGLVLGKILSDKMKLPLSVITAKSYTTGKQTNQSLVIGTLSGLNPPKNNILLVDDLIETGQTIQEIEKRLKENYPSISKINTATIYKKEKSPFEPTFFLKETSKWIVFPYEKTEFQK
jgi:hypothetical protein